MTISDVAMLPFVALQLGLLPTTFIIVIFFRQVQNGLDVLIFPSDEPTRHEGKALRAVSDALPRQEPGLNPNAMEPKEFKRLTRRALSNMGDLSKLAASPLIQLEAVEARLDDDTSTLARANALRTLLTGEH